MSWSVNWPTNVDPAVIVGLSGLVPYGFAAGGLPFTVGSTIRFFGPAARSSAASMIPPGMPTSSSAARTWSLASANGGRLGKIRPNRPSLAGAPGTLGRPRAPDDVAAFAAVLIPGSIPAEAAASPAPASTWRRDGPDFCWWSFITKHPSVPLMSRMPRMARCQSDPIPQAADVALALGLPICHVGFGYVGGGHAAGDRARPGRAA